MYTLKESRSCMYHNCSAALNVESSLTLKSIPLKPPTKYKCRFSSPF